MAVPTIELSGSALRGVYAGPVPERVMAALPQRVCLGANFAMALPPVLRLESYFNAEALEGEIQPRDWAARAAEAIARMYLNDREGICVIAGLLHALGIWSANDPDSGGIIEATDQEAHAQYQSICGPGDRGCDITQVLDVFRSRGLMAGGKYYTIDAYVTADWTSKLLVQSSLNELGPAALGVQLPRAWTQNAVWDVTSSPTVGGHFVTPIDWVPEGVRVASWGRIYLMTWAAWLSRRWTMMFCPMLSPSWYNADRLAPSGFNAEVLRADLAKIGRGIIPVPDPGPPVPPIPPTPPVPAVGDIRMAVDLTNKSISVAAPPGWTVNKLRGDEDMHAQSHAVKLAEELEAMLPKMAGAEGVAAGDFGSFIGRLQELILAVKASDWKAAMVALGNLLVMLGGGTTTGGDVIHFSSMATSAGFNLKDVLAILIKLAPLIIGAL